MFLLPYMSIDTLDIGSTQRTLWEARKKFIQDELKTNESRLSEVNCQLDHIPNSHALNEEVCHTVTISKCQTNVTKYTILRQHHEMLTSKATFVEHLTGDVNRFLATEMEDNRTFNDKSMDQLPTEEGDYLKQVLDEVNSFNNRFIVHNIQMKWNNTLRNVLIRYIQHVSQRRGFSYYMSQKAVRFLTTIVDEQLRAKQAQKDKQSTQAHNNSTVNGTGDDHVEQDHDEEIENLIQQLLEDKEHFIVADESSSDTDKMSSTNGDQSVHKATTEELNPDYEAINNYIFRIVSPQIQLQSEKNPDSAIVLAAQGMQIKILAINDKTVAQDDVSVLVQRRFTLKMTGAQFFSAQQRDFHGAVANLLTQNTYGAVGESCWPPWLPIESVYDFDAAPRAFSRIVTRTSALMTYIKNNNLRIKKNDRIAQVDRINTDEVEDRTDSVTVNFPKFNLTANSEQYYAMYTIVMDLLMYSEPLQKERNEQIEKILLAADFSDLSGAPEMVCKLQKRIRQMNEFKTMFKLNACRVDMQSKKDEIRVEKALLHCEDELFFLMKSVATAQEKNEDRDSEVVAAMKWHLKADEILWHLMEGDNAFIDFGLSKASFQRTDHSDSSNFNTLEVEMMQGINLSPDPVFTEMFAPYFGKDRTVLDARRSKMVRVYWYMLEAIGGITICDHFEVNLFPLRLQMEQEVGKKIMAYVFPDKQENSEYADSDSESAGSDSESATSSESEAESISRMSHAKKLLKKGSKLSLDRLVHPGGRSPFGHHSNSSDRLAPDTASVRSHGSRTTSSSKLSRTASNQTLQRYATNSNTISKNGKQKNTGSADDLTAMMSRASKNVSLVYVKIPSVILSLSYKGSKAKNFTDVTDFAFRLPTIEYRNKTWSQLDLAENLKREVIKAVLAHTGSLLKDKMTKHRRSGGRKPALSRQLSNYRNFIPAEKNEQRFQEVNSGNQLHTEQGPHGALPSQSRTSTIETSSIIEDHPNHGLFNNAIGRHLHHLSHMARHKDGLSEDNPESTIKKTRMLLGKFIDKGK